MRFNFMYDMVFAKVEGNGNETNLDIILRCFSGTG